MTQKLGREPGEVAFVSSNSWDVIGAKTFGFWTCWVNRQGAALDQLGVAPDLAIDSLTGLTNALKT